MNILLINADQLRHDSVGYRGLRGVKTPNLDALAAESVVFSSAYTPLPVCAPARQAILSGRRPDAIGAQWNFDFMPTPELDPDICWPGEMTRRGWQTGYIGRFHVSATRNPADFGFQRFADKREYKRFVSEKYPDAQYEGGWLGCESPIPVEDSETHWIAARAGEMLTDFSKEKSPWLMWVDFEVPHLPCRPSSPYATMYDPKTIQPWDGWGDDFKGKPYIHKQQTLSWDTAKYEWKDFQPMVARYFGWITQLDDAIGRILTQLKETGQYDDTAIVFTSDHGDMCGSHSMLDKHYVLYDDIIRVPLLMKIPGVSPRVTDAFVMNCLDIPASIRKWAGLEKEPLGHGKPLPETPEEDEGCAGDVVVTSNGQQFGLYTTRAIRTREYKYVWNLTDVDELYDLRLDPGEKRNRVADPALQGVLHELRRHLYDQLKAVGDRFVNSEWMRRQLLENKKYVPQEEIQ